MSKNGRKIPWRQIGGGIGDPQSVVTHMTRAADPSRAGAGFVCRHTMTISQLEWRGNAQVPD